MNPETIQTINTIFSIGTVIVQISSIILLVLLFSKKESRFKGWITRNALTLVFFAAFLATLGSLTYSEIVKFTPCALCWYQRILMYPLVFLSLVALTKKFSKEIWYYIRTLSGIGGSIALYHYIIKVAGSSPFPCSATGPSCVKQFVLELGYIDIPMMSFSFFLIIFILSFYGTKNKAA